MSKSKRNNSLFQTHYRIVESIRDVKYFLKKRERDQRKLDRLINSGQFGKICREILDEDR